MHIKYSCVYISVACVYISINPVVVSGRTIIDTQLLPMSYSAVAKCACQWGIVHIAGAMTVPSPQHRRS